MPMTTTTTLTELVPQILGEARMWFADASLFYPKQGIAESFLQWRDLRGVPGSSATFNKYAAIEFGDATEGTDYTDVQVMDTSGPATIASTERVINVPITDKALDSVQTGRAGLIAECGRQIGLAAAAKFDKDVMALFASLTAAPSGGTSTGTAVTVAKFGVMITGLESVPVPEPYAAIFHTKGWGAFLAESSSPLLNAAASDSVGKEVWGSHFAKQIMGVNCFKHSKVPANGTTDFYGAMMSAWALGCVWKKDLSIEAQRDATLRGTEFVGVMDYGVGVIDATAGYVMLQDYVA